MNIGMGTGGSYLATVFDHDQLVGMLDDARDIIADIGACTRPCCKSARAAWSQLAEAIQAAIGILDTAAVRYLGPDDGSPVPSPRAPEPWPGFVEAHPSGRIPLAQMMPTEDGR